MNFPAINLVLIAAFHFYLSPVAHAGEAEALRSARCSGANASSYRCQAIRNFYRGASGLPSGAGACEERRKRAEECCKSWSPSSTCMGMLDDAGRRNLEGLMGPTPAPGTDPESVYGAITKDRVKNEKGRNGAESMEGLCRASMDACVDGCKDASTAPAAGSSGVPDNPTNQRSCEGLKSYADGFKAQAANYQNAVDEGIQNAGKAGASPGNAGGGGGGGSGSGGSGSGTQQPKKGEGGGNPMGDLMKALGGMMNQQQDNQQQQQIPPPQDCSSNLALAGCPVPKAEGSDSWNKKAGEADMREPEEKADGENFNVASGENGTNGFDGNGEKKFSTPPTVNPVQGGGGGGIPGQGGGAPAAAGAAGGGYAMAAKNLADVMQGTRGGGGYAAQNQAMQMQNGSAAGGFTYGAGNEGGMRGMDLRQFLPGGKNDPTRKLAGGNGPGLGTGTQIQSQSVNIWNRISERFKSRCIQGLLRDCIP